MGLLDDILAAGQNGGASPYGALYQAPDAAAQDALLKKQAAEQAQASFLRGLMENPTEGVGNPNPAAGPSALVSPQPAAPASIFGPTPQIPQAAAAPQPQGFGAGATPFGFAGPGSMTGISPAMMQQQPAPAPQTAQPPVAPAAAPPVVAADDGPDRVMPVGNYQMPVYGEAGAAPSAPAAAAVPAAAPASAPFSLAGAGSAIGDRLMKGTKGFIGNLQNGPIGAVAGGLGALITGNSTDPGSIAAQKSNLTSQALLAKGAAPADIIAAQNNPALMTALVNQYYGKDKFKVQQTGEDSMGKKTFQLFNEADGTFKPIAGNGDTGAPGGGGGGIGDMSKTGAAYMATVPPLYAKTVSGMIDGTIQPPSAFALAKPYWQTMLAAAKNADPSFDENTWAGRHKMTVDLATSGNNTMGGILSNGKSAFDHLATYSGKLADVGDYNGPDIPGGAAIAGIGNFVGNRLLPTSQNLGKIAGANTAAIKYGQESTKFYAGSGGGEGERMSALANNDASKTTGNEQAGFLQTEKELMLGRLREKEDQIRSTMGDAYLQQHPVMTPQLQATIATIDGNIAKLRGQGGAAPAPAAGAGSLQPGQSTMIGNISIKRVN